VDEWFKARNGGNLTEPLLEKSSLIYEQLRPEPVKSLLEEHRSGRQDNHKLLFSLVMLEQWLRGVHSNFDEDHASAAA
jgi:asparagine synthase (glutamine-hydrolysing)